MPRKHRIHYRNALYHVMLRGNYRQTIFYDDSDRKYFYEKLSEVANSYLCKIHLFCLMSNHIHLVVEVSDIPLSKFTQGLATSYARNHNLRFNKNGHLFQGRYKAKLIQDDHYLLELCYYIHQNPIKAGMCFTLNEYRWSSHLAYSNLEKLPWLTTNHINMLLKKYVDVQSDHYNFFMNYRNEISEKPMFCTFNEDGELIITDTVKLKMNKKPMLVLENIPLTQISEVICKGMNITMKALVSESQRRHVILARSLVFYFGHYHAKYKILDIAILLNRNPDSLSRALRRQFNHSKHAPEIKKWIELFESKFLAADLKNSVL